MLVLLLVVLAACGGGSHPADETAATGPTGLLVVFVRYGGLAGTNDGVAVNTSGEATIIRDRSPEPAVRVLPPSDLAALRTALERSRMATLERNYLDPRMADAYQYDITYQGVTVTADEGVDPDGLRPVVDQLTKLLAER